MFASCPFCHITLPCNELEWHANNHLVEDELARDMELAQEIALASPSCRSMVEEMNYADTSHLLPERTGQTSDTSNAAKNDEIFGQGTKHALVGLQIKSTFYKVESGLMSLLKRCLESETKTHRSVISGYIDHYQSIVSEDSGWGCGYRNIQMLSSHLLMLREEARYALYGGSRFVPDIASLQRWIEIAWEKGFDSPGSISFNKKIYGSRKWIGAVECATLLRSFGLRARIIDFDSDNTVSSTSTSNAGGKRTREEVYGPMDKFLHQSKSNDLQARSSLNGYRNQHRDSLNKCKGKVKGHQALVDWVWNYFTNEVRGGFNKTQSVLVSEKSPLYFQHDGHSRTIVGIQKQQGKRGSEDQYSLLVLDPGQRTEDLERCLTGNRGWQQLVKRGVHTLRKPQYQLCYVDPGIAIGEEFEQLMAISSFRVQL